MSRQRIDARVDVHRALEAGADGLQKARNLMSHTDALRGIAADTGDQGDAGAVVTPEPPANDIDAIGTGHTDLMKDVEGGAHGGA